MGKNVFETLVGAVVLFVAIGFVVIAYKGGNIEVPEGKNLTARFERIDGLHVGSDVRLSGLVIGKVVKQSLDTKTYEAVVEISVDSKIDIPKNSTAEIISDGLLGNKFLALVPGGDLENLQNGDEITITQSSISIEALIGKFVFGGADDKKDKKSEDDSDPFDKL